MIRRLACLLVLAACLQPTPGLAAVQVGSLYSSLFTPIAIGDLSTNPGLECLGYGADGVARIFALDSGQPLATLPAPFQIPGQNEYTLRDFDGDGLAEILCVLSGPEYTSTVGLLDVTSSVTRVWPDQSFDDVITTVDLVDLNSSEPKAIALGGFDFHVLSSQTGALLYDMWTDGTLPSQLRFQSMTVDDFDGDGRQEVLVDTYDATQSTYPIVLIGDQLKATAVGGLSDAGRVMLRQSWPNPAVGSTHLAYELGEASPVKLRIFDAGGRLVRTLVDGRVNAGAHQETWDGRDQAGKAVARGIYFYELDVSGRRQSRKLVQLR